MSIGVDGDQGASFLCHAHVAISEVKSPWIGVQFKCGVMLACCSEQLCHVRRQTFTFIDQSSCRMSDGMDEWVFDGFQNAFRRFLRVLPKARVGAGNDPVKSFKNLIVVVE